ncbi:hypothetical protein [Candidatus Poriferisocius sp.]|uniref:hypothetical protein n=1 Tax=Candidatus Poriferisocius sp. TaxID=3101276 RepID=UPI003B0194C6
MVDSRFEKVESRFEKVEAEMKAMEGRLTLQMSNLARTVIFAIIGFSLATILSVVGMGLAIALT